MNRTRPTNMSEPCSMDLSSFTYREQDTGHHNGPWRGNSVIKAVKYGAIVQKLNLECPIVKVDTMF